jgi:hypothetical protein
MPAPLPRASESVVCSDVGDGAVLLDTATEIYFGLNSVGARIWALLPEAESLDALCERLLELYPDAPAGELRTDVEELLNELAQHGLLIGQPV